MIKIINNIKIILHLFLLDEEVPSKGQKKVVDNSKDDQRETSLSKFNPSSSHAKVNIQH